MIDVKKAIRISNTGSKKLDNWENLLSFGIIKREYQIHLEVIFTNIFINSKLN